MKKTRTKDGFRWCSQCKRELPASNFLVPRKRGWNVVFCDSCASENMACWARTRNVGMMPEDISEIDI